MTTDQLGISVVLCTYKKDRADHIRTSLESIKRQTKRPNEIVIVEDGPITDELQKVLSEFELQTEIPINRVRHEKNRGHGAARRTGVKTASHKLIAIQDADDIATPFRLEVSANKLLSSDADVVGGYIQEFTEDGRDMSNIRVVPQSPAEITKRAKLRSPINHTTIIARRDAILRAGNYRQMGQMEDYELIVRMINDGYKIVNVPRVLARVRAGTDMLKRRGGRKYIRSELSLQKRFVEIGFVTPARAIFNFIVRSIPRVMPSRVRKLIYSRLLRH